MECVWQVEKETFCLKVLETHWPDVKRRNEILNSGVENLEPVDLICAGIPCQDVSVAGRRAGLAGERTGLFYEFARILQELRPAWFVFENVPGLFSSNGGRDFAEILRVLMVECGYGICWRVLNSQFFGVAQRRRRVFIVGSLGRPCPPEVLFEPTRSARNSQTSDEERKDVAFTLAASIRGTGDGHGNAWNSNYIARALACSGVSSGYRYDPNGEEYVFGPLHSHERAGGWMPNSEEAAEGALAVATLNSGGNNGGFRTEPGEHIVCIKGTAIGRQPENGPQWGEFTTDGKSFTLNRTEQHAVAFIHPRQLRNSDSSNQVGIKVGASVSDSFTSEGPGAVAFAENQRGEIRTSRVAQQLSAGGGKPGSGYAAALCSPSDSHGMRDSASLPKGLDSARYRALGNAVTVSVARWIGERILQCSTPASKT